jgi:hypothetical protein
MGLLEPDAGHGNSAGPREVINPVYPFHKKRHGSNAVAFLHGLWYNMLAQHNHHTQPHSYSFTRQWAAQDYFSGEFQCRSENLHYSGILLSPWP